MFLTRLGFNSKAVVTGDITQIDLPSGQHSGLNVVREILTGIDDLAFVYLSSRDVVSTGSCRTSSRPTGATTRPGPSGPRAPHPRTGPQQPGGRD